MKITKQSLSLVSLLIFLFSFNTKAQFGRIGIQASVLYADWEGEKTNEFDIAYDGKTGASVGIYFIKEFSANWNLEYGMNFSWKGFTLNGQLMIPGVQLGANLINQSIYLDVPVSIRYIIGEYGPSGFFIKAGVQFSYLAYNKIDGHVLYNGTNFYGDPQSNANELNRFDLAIFPGIGYQFNNGFNLQLIYERGLINIIKDDEYLGLTSAYNSVIRLQFGIDL